MFASPVAGRMLIIIDGRFSVRVENLNVTDKLCIYLVLNHLSTHRLNLYDILLNSVGGLDSCHIKLLDAYLKLLPVVLPIVITDEGRNPETGWLNSYLILMFLCISSIGCFYGCLI